MKSPLVCEMTTLSPCDAGELIWMVTPGRPSPLYMMVPLMDPVWLVCAAAGIAATATATASNKIKLRRFIPNSPYKKF